MHVEIIIFELLGDEGIERNPIIGRNQDAAIVILVLVGQLVFSCAGAVFGQKLLIALRSGQHINVDVHSFISDFNFE